MGALGTSDDLHLLWVPSQEPPFTGSETSAESESLETSFPLSRVGGTIAPTHRTEARTRGEHPSDCDAAALAAP